jgi:hypothetical protein
VVRGIAWCVCVACCGVPCVVLRDVFAWCCVVTVTINHERRRARELFKMYYRLNVGPRIKKGSNPKGLQETLFFVLHLFLLMYIRENREKYEVRKGTNFKVAFQDEKSTREVLKGTRPSKYG